MIIVQKEVLEGYDERLETARQKRFDEFMAATEPSAQRNALEALADLTSLRSPAFVADYELALGLREAA
ncbi:MAG: hypothetical protein IIA07_00015 [Proteobacteria bacterium]|nr:hypothetical protein [Pseudomonadota bacterium]